MKKPMLLVLILAAVSAFAQNSPIPTKTFSFAASAISLPGSKGTFVGTDAGVTYNPTQNFALEETNVMSSDARLAFFGGGVDYQAQVLSRKINDVSPNTSGFKLRLGVRAVAGLARTKDALGNVGQHYGYLAQGTFAYSFDSGGTWQFGANVGVARFPGFSKGVTPVVEVGPQIHF